ncbi:MAG: asparagine synthase (glutamine-hydrolyzing) [Patescibacteria group bacterium]
MCGIAGFINYSNQQDPTLLNKALNCIVHRGPDDDGMFRQDAFQMGMRRLSIIDIAHGKQPIANEDGTVTVVFNGEIYNYLELKIKLVTLGHVFKTESDTECLVHGFEEWGKDLPKHLRGMFAFSIHDSKTNTLLIARDQFGIKPLYYRLENNSIVSYASEIKSLLVDASYKKQINIPAVHAYATFQYNPFPETFFKDISKLSPGHSLTINLTDGIFKIEKYWQFSLAPKEGDFEQKKKDIEKTIIDSVNHHMIADVPVASFLSSGVDSSIIASLAHKHIQSKNPDQKLTTYTIGFGTDRSEIDDAREFAKYLGTDHKEIQVSFDDYFSVLKKCAWHFDEPVADPSAISMYLMAREVAKHHKVVLSGEGADELFGGYGIYAEPHNPWIQLISLQPAWFKKYVLKPADFVTQEIVDMFPVLAKTPGVSFLHRALQPVRERYIGNAKLFSEQEKDVLFKKYTAVNPVTLLDTQKENIDGYTESEYMQYIDVLNWMRGDILAKADKMTMAHSLELRVPFLDMEVYNVSRDIPDAWKYKNNTTKFALRDAFASYMPAKTNHRPKLGFPTPWHTWLQRDCGTVKKTILSSPIIQELCHEHAVEKLFTKKALADKFIGRRIFVLLQLSLWYDVYIDENKPA